MKRLNIKKVIKVVLIILVISLIVGTPLFFYAKISAEGRAAMREAKNAKLYLEMLEVEAYAYNSSIYDYTESDGLKQGVLKKLRDFMDKDCSVKITSYNKKGRKITGMIYETGKYQVEYSVDNEGKNHWSVNYIRNVIRYDEE